MSFSGYSIFFCGATVSANRAKKFAFFLVVSKVFPIFVPDSVSPLGREGHNLLVKRTFTNVIFGRRISQIQVQKKRNEASTLGVLYTAHFIMDIVNISRRGLSSCLSWTRQCESPTAG